MEIRMNTTWMCPLSKPRHQMGTSIRTPGVLKNLLSFGLKEARMEEETWATSKKIQKVLEMN